MNGRVALRALDAARVASLPDRRAARARRDFRRRHVEHELAHGRGRACAMDGCMRAHRMGRRGDARRAGLPFCDVHNGMAFPPDACASRSRRLAARRALSRRSSVPRDAGPRAPARYAKKLAALRAMWARLDAMGVRLVALQEVFDASAVRAILPPHWSVATTRELPGAPTIAQHVGVAWRRGVDVRATSSSCASLADSGLPDRPLRPGLAFTVDVGGKPVRVLVVHLKAGCRSRDLDVPLTREGRALLTDARQDAITADCALLALPASFARGVDRRQRRARLRGDGRLQPHDPARADRRVARRTGRALDGTRGERSARPLHDRAQGTRVTSRNATRARARCFPSSTTTSPPGAVLWRARFADQGRNGAIPKGSSGDCSIAGARGDLTHDGIDHIVIRESLKKRLAPTALTMRAVNYHERGGRRRCAAAATSRCLRIIARTSSRGHRFEDRSHDRHANAKPQLLERAGRDLAGGGLGLFVLPPELNLVVARGEGSRVFDVAGREYIDYHLGSGPALLGHAHPAITAAVAAQLPQGHDVLLPERAGDRARAASWSRRFPCADAVHYTGSGTEATFYALRIARAFTGRNKVLKFEGAWHGMHDYGLWGTVPSTPSRLSARAARLDRRAAAKPATRCWSRRSTRPSARSR